MSDQFTGIFDDLTPEDFTRRTTSAVTELDRIERSFDDFIADMLRAVRFAFASASGEIDPLATLAGGHVERVFAPDDDETVGNFIDRLAREAKVLDAEWLFIYKRTVVGTFQSDDGGSVDGPDAMQSALDAGTTQEAIYWYAEDRSSGESERRHGFLTIVGNHLGDQVEGNSVQTVRAFTRILGGQS